MNTLECSRCGESITPKQATWLFGVPYCDECSDEVLPEDDVRDD